jgi:hypothetical protein
MELKPAIQDFVFYTGHDMIKKRGSLPSQKELMENALASGGYHLFLKKMNIIPLGFMSQVSQPYAEDISQFIVQSLLIWGKRYITKEPRPLGQIALKQLLSQGSNKLITQGI